LIALADDPAATVGLSDADPALSLFLLRFTTPALEPDSFGFAPGALYSASLPATAAAYLGATRDGLLPYQSLTYHRLRDYAERAAHLAAAVADATRLVPPRAAATVARLLPLGWYAVLAIDPWAARDPLSDLDYPHNPAGVQARVWGLDHAAITRRLAARWRLPAWVATPIGCLTLPLRVAGPLVSHRDLFAVVQFAALEAEDAARPLGLAQGADRRELIDYLRLDDSALEAARLRMPESRMECAVSPLDPDPHRVPLVMNLLRMATECRRRNGPGLVARLEEHIDHLHRVAAELGEQAGRRLRDAKLEGLAELAAGAGHEINNPLAVISGNAQRLARSEENADRRESLGAIVRQAHRIAGILRDLMQFARPPRPVSRVFAVADLLHGVRDDLVALAQERHVRLEVEAARAGVWLEGDPAQLREALRAVVRNAVEAAPPDGWARVSWVAAEDGCDVSVTVEDSGPGLTPDAALHAFDPFYSGRSAGRGRGLGLSAAWQLTRQNGGSLLLACDCPARFVLTLRRVAAHDALALRSA
jgi:signal transduction histidine kinase